MKPYQKRTASIASVPSTPKPASKLVPKTPSATPLKVKAETPAVAADDLTALDGDLKDLPVWVADGWISRYLPTLYSFFFSSTEPFKHFSKSDPFVGFVQVIVKLVYPEASYTAKLGDPIVQKVRGVGYQVLAQLTCVLTG